MAQKMMVPKKTVASHRERRQSNASIHYDHIDGIRGIAILMVVIFHMFIFKVSSGVDIFLFIGGIFLVSSQMKNASCDNGLSFLQSCIRLLRRLMPAMVTVILVTMAIMVWIYPPSSLWTMCVEAVSALFYAFNWQQISAGQDYARLGDNPSVFQHLWSMSVQMQIYIGVVVLVYVTGYILRVRHSDIHRRTWTILVYSCIGVMTVTSFVYAIYLHGANQTMNYYSTFSRLWEIGLGAFIGVAITHRVYFVTWIRHVMSVTGFVMIFVTGVLFDGAHQFPGPYTLVPIVGACLVILSGFTAKTEQRSWKTIGLTRLLDTKPCVKLGSMAYSLYLTHWVVALIATTVFPEVNFVLRGVVCLPIIAVATFALYTLVEKPCRQMKKPELDFPLRWGYARDAWFGSSVPMRVRAGVIVGMCLCVGLTPVMYQGYDRIQHHTVIAASNKYGGFYAAYPGARSLIDGVEVPDGVGIQPSPSDDVSTMMPPTTFDGCYAGKGVDELVFTDKDGNPCAYGDTDSKKTLYVVGASHSEQYLPALDSIGKKRHVKIIPVIKMGCPLVNEGREDGQDFSDCDRWSEKAIRWIVDNPPTEGIFITSTRPTTLQGVGPDVVQDSYRKIFATFADAKIPIYAMRDNPWIRVKDKTTHEPLPKQLNARACVSSGGSVEDCGMKQKDTLADVNPAIEGYKNIPGIHHIDFTPLFCQNGMCPAVIGNVLVYRDAHHLTDIFVKTLEPFLESALFDNGWDAQKVQDIIAHDGNGTVDDVTRNDDPERKITVPTEEQEVNPYMDEKDLSHYTTSQTPAPSGSITMEDVPDV